MTRALSILFVHGIGSDRTETYPKPLEDNLKREFIQALRQLKVSDALKREASTGNPLHFKAVCWDCVTQPPQDALLKLLFKRGFSIRSRLKYTIRKNMVHLLGDMTAYERDLDNKVYKAIHEQVGEGMADLEKAAPSDEYAPLTIIGHSLGSVIASDYVWDHTRGSGHKSHLLDDHRLALVNMVLMGSPMALYALRNNPGETHKDIQKMLDSPITIEPENGQWLNIFDQHDPVAFPLERIESYKAAGVIDCPVKVTSGIAEVTLLSHAYYWRSDEVARLIGRKLAIDWARINEERFAERYHKKAIREYRKDSAR
jgi:hypothetical protein